MPLKTGAVIVAAGLSSRMGGFKPMLKAGSVSMVQRVILTLRQAGADLIVVVTGHEAELLEDHLSDMGVVCIRNHRYMDSQMLDSVKIGLSCIRGRCDRVLFTPADVPMFTPDTVKSMLEDGSPLVIPVYDGREGHPLLIASELIPPVLCYGGDNGLSGALKNCGCERRLLKVNDSGVLFDVDTPEDYSKVMALASHN
ncbi:MAG: nucleotidyltransferase family protein [Oscillospiraceae bacterium]|nr:nucleotidyltransferase family protein [Oscillospiraceae bacterium]